MTFGIRAGLPEGGSGGHVNWWNAACRWPYKGCERSRHSQTCERRCQGLGQRVGDVGAPREIARGHEDVAFRGNGIGKSVCRVAGTATQRDMVVRSFIEHSW